MNRYDELYNFRIASRKDIDSVMLFLKTEWGENHILANDKEFFIWQYGNEQYGDHSTINFVLMEDKKGTLVGVNGFIPYAPAGKRRYVSSAITKVKSDIKIPMAGIELIKRFKELVPADAYYSSGTNPKTMIPIGAKVFHYTTGILQQYYVLNPTRKEFKIAFLKEELLEKKMLKDIWKLREILSFHEINEHYDLQKQYAYQGYKSPEYIEKRYFQHPIYKYKAFGLYQEDQIEYSGILVAREIQVNDSKILRFVDYLGEIRNLSGIGVSLQNLLIQSGYEYADFVVGSIEEELLEGSGFRLRKEEAIIPMYFDPFLRENIEIWYQKSKEEIVIFKADGDQDRPNHR